MHVPTRARISFGAAVLITAFFAAPSTGSAAAASLPTLRPAALGGQIQQTLLATAGHPASGFPESWGISHRDLLDIGAGLVVLLLLVFLVVRRRRASAVHAPDTPHPAFPQTPESWRGSGLSEDSAAPLPRFEHSSVMIPTVGPGWHPVQGDPLRMAYWDGANWSAFRQWDGHQWVDPTSIAP